MRKLAPLLLLLVVVAPTAAKDAASDPKLGRKRLEAATKVVDQLAATSRLSTVDAETQYRWSVRALDARLDQADAKETAAAFDDHLHHMKLLQGQIKSSYDKGMRTSLEVDEANYYVEEAELWNARGKK